MNNWLGTAKGIFLSFALIIFVTGCSNSGSNYSSYDLAPGTATIFGRALIDGEAMEGARVILVSGSGYVIPLASKPVVDGGGFFEINLQMIPEGSFVVFVKTADGINFANEIEILASNETIYVNPVTTLEYSYHKAYPALSINDVHTLIRNFLGVRAYTHTGDEILNYMYSRFSGKTFMKAALAHPLGFEGYLDELVVKAGGTPDQPRVENNELLGKPNGSLIIPDEDVDQYLANMLSDGRQETIDLRDFHENAMIQRRASHQPEQIIEKEIRDEMEGGASKILVKVGEDIVGNIVNFVMGLFIPGNDAAALQEIMQQLGQIEQGLEQISDEIINVDAYIAKEFTAQSYLTASSSIKANTDEINNYSNYLYQSAVYSSSQDMTDFATQISNLNQKTYKDIYADAVAIHEAQFAPIQPGVQSLISLTRRLTGADDLLSDVIILNLSSQQNYYTGVQTQALMLINSLGGPSSFILPQPPNAKSTSSPAGFQNDANLDIDKLYLNINSEMSALPYQLLDASQVYDFKNTRLFQKASVSSSTSGTTYNYAASLSSGGINGGWQIASEDAHMGLYNLMSGAPASYTGALSSYGFSLQPGPVTYHKWTKMQNSQGISWQDDGEITATPSGFLTLTYDSSGNYTAGWIDDKGKTGNIATFKAGTSVQAMLDGDKTYYAGQENGYMATYYYYYGRINGPSLIMYDLNNINSLTTQQPSFLPVALGLYNNFTLTNDAPVGDDAFNVSATQQLYAV